MAQRDRVGTNGRDAWSFHAAELNAVLARLGRFAHRHR